MAEAVKNVHVSDEIAIQIVAMNKWYGEFHVLRDINLTVYKGERIVICGPSGSGKSTLIRCINRLEEHQKGDIVVDGIPLTNDLKKIEVRREVAWCSSTSTCFRISPRSRIARWRRSGYARCQRRMPKSWR
jgi:general L-amino acid transport system ATP-binding protein